jgi:hypothetical protein
MASAQTFVIVGASLAGAKILRVVLDMAPLRSVWEFGFPPIGCTARSPRYDMCEMAGASHGS